MNKKKKEKDRKGWRLGTKALTSFGRDHMTEKYSGSPRANRRVSLSKTEGESVEVDKMSPFG